MARNTEVTDINLYRNQRRKTKNVRWVIIPVFLVACLFAGYFFSMSGIFSVRNIVLEGNELVSAEQAAAICRIEKGMNIFSVNTRLSEELLQILPRVSQAHVSRRLPSTVKITITERQSVAMMNVGQAVIELDGSGRILDRYTVLERDALPLITGVDTEGVGLIPGCYLKGESMEKALEILASLPEDAEDIGEINVQDPEDIKLYTLSGMEIRLGDSKDFGQKYQLYTAIIKENQEGAGKAIKYIDVSILEKPAFAFK